MLNNVYSNMFLYAFTGLSKPPPPKKKKKIYKIYRKNWGDDIINSLICIFINVTRSVVMVSWFTLNYCACAPMLYISELCEDCAVANEIDYAWASIHDNGHVITGVWRLTSTAHSIYDSWNIVKLYNFIRYLPYSFVIFLFDRKKKIF